MKADAKTEAEIGTLLTRLTDSYERWDVEGFMASQDVSGGPLDGELAGG